MEGDRTSTEHKTALGERCVSYNKKACRYTICICAVCIAALVALRVTVLSADSLLSAVFLLYLITAVIFIAGLFAALAMRRDFFIRIDKKGIRYWKRFHVEFFPWEWLSDYTIRYFQSSPSLVLFLNENGLEENNRGPVRRGRYRNLSKTISLGFSDDPDKIPAYIDEMNPHSARRVTPLELELRQRSEKKKRILTGIFAAAVALYIIWDCFQENDEFLMFGRTATFIAVIAVVGLFQVIVYAVYRIFWYNTAVQPLPAFIISTAIVSALCVAAMIGIDHINDIDDFILQQFMYDIFVNFNFIPNKHGYANMLIMFIMEPAAYCYITGSAGASLCRTEKGTRAMSVAAAAIAILLLVALFWVLFNCMDTL